MTTLNGFQITRKKLTSLSKAPHNPRKISDHDAKALQKSLSTFGTVEPIVWNKQTGNIVGGHQRLDALLTLGEKETDVLIVDLPEEQEQALNIALNRISGEWDNGLLSDVLLAMHEELRELTGFSENEIVALLPKQEGLTDADSIPEVVEPVAKLGDIWQLGQHRLMCGDSTDAGSVALLMDGDIADMVHTDPPYNLGYTVDIDPDYRKAWPQFKNDILKTPEDWDRFVCAFIKNAFDFSKKPCPMYVWIDWRQFQFIRERMQKTFPVKACIVWAKVGGSPAWNGGDYKCAHEFCLYGKNGPHTHFSGEYVEPDVWIQQKLNTASYVHPTQKPIELIEIAIGNSCKSGESVLELFGGSGSTLMACEKISRKCFTMELDPHYCDVIIKRWEDFTGKKAEKIA